MQIGKNQNRGTPPSTAATSHDLKAAREHAALFHTRLALGRWTRGGDIPHLHLFGRDVPLRASWYESARRHFQAWLEGGGFHQCGFDDADSAIREASAQSAQAAAAPCLACCEANASASRPGFGQDSAARQRASPACDSGHGDVQPK